MTDKDKMQYIHYMQMKNELDNVSRSGVTLKLDGDFSSAHAIASVCVFHENNDYMRDYIRDKTGRVAELNFGICNRDINS